MQLKYEEIQIFTIMFWKHFQFLHRWGNEIILKYYYNAAYVCLSGIISKYCRTVQRCFYKMNICTTVHVYILPGISTAEQYNVASTECIFVPLVHVYILPGISTAEQYNVAST